jgi:hypothetical protein
MSYERIVQNLMHYALHFLVSLLYVLIINIVRYVANYMYSLQYAVYIQYVCTYCQQSYDALQITSTLQAIVATVTSGAQSMLQAVVAIPSTVAWLCVSAAEKTKLVATQVYVYTVQNMNLVKVWLCSLFTMPKWKSQPEQEQNLAQSAQKDDVEKKKKNNVEVLNLKNDVVNPKPQEDLTTVLKSLPKVFGSPNDRSVAMDEEIEEWNEENTLSDKIETPPSSVIRLESQMAKHMLQNIRSERNIPSLEPLQSLRALQITPSTMFSMNYEIANSSNGNRLDSHSSRKRSISQAESEIQNSGESDTVRRKLSYDCHGTP